MFYLKVTTLGRLLTNLYKEYNPIEHFETIDYENFKGKNFKFDNVFYIASICYFLCISTRYVIVMIRLKKEQNEKYALHARNLCDSKERKNEILETFSNNCFEMINGYLGNKVKEENVNEYGNEEDDGNQDEYVNEDGNDDDECVNEDGNEDDDEYVNEEEDEDGEEN